MITKLSENTIKISGRTDSNNVAEFEKKLLSAAGENYADITLDAAELEYISSAGLRVLLKLKKGTKGKVSVINVSPEIYDIFNVTGFDNILDVKKAMRELSIEGMELIGRGATGSVYRMDKETIIKVFNPQIGIDMIERENTKAKDAFIFGVPTAISYDTVKVGDCYGVVYELLDAQDLAGVIKNDKAHIEEHIKNFALKMREMHSIEIDERFNQTKETSIQRLGLLKGKVCTAEEVEKLRAIIKNVPDRNTFIHGDAHIGNVMLQNGEYMFIDLAGASKGHPIFDIWTMYLSFKMGQETSEETRNGSDHIRGFTNEDMQRIWNTYIKTYLDTDDTEFIQKAEEQIKAVTCARIVNAAIEIPGFFSQSQIEFFKNTAVAYYDKGMEPICF
ncbi:MAG: phosphotransferase [Firmicutes bacterium]|nr:phosphotransferase [Bacillota bacterium]